MYYIPTRTKETKNKMSVTDNILCIAILKNMKNYKLSYYQFLFSRLKI